MSFYKKKTTLSYCKNKSKIWGTVQALTFLIYLDKASKEIIKHITIEQTKTIQFIPYIFILHTFAQLIYMLNYQSYLLIRNAIYLQSLWFYLYN